MITLMPAYGRDYSDGKEVKKAFLDNKDFIIADGVSNGIYCNAADLNQLGSKDRKVKLRYNKLRDAVIVDIPDKAMEVKVKKESVGAGEITGLKIFDNWLVCVDEIVIRRCGIGIDDMRDRNFRDGFDSGMSPLEYVDEEYGLGSDEILEDDLFG